MSDALLELRRRAAERDANDELAPFRGRFAIADEALVYLDGNSLGRLPMATARRLDAAVREEWGARLIGGWNAGWWEAPRRIGSKIAQLIGAREHEVVVVDSVSVNLFKVAAALLSSQRQGARRILVETTNFPSDHYIAQGLAGLLHDVVVERIMLDGLPNAESEAALARAFANGPGVAILSHVAFRSGARLDMARINAVAGERGVVVVWDLSHSVGAVPIDAAAEGIVAAVGCTYKYLNGGPGAPAFVHVRDDAAGRLANPVAGWFGHRAPFAMSLDYEPAEGVARFLAGTTPIISALAVECGVDLTLEAGIGRLWGKSLAQVEFLRFAAESLLAPHRFRVATPGTMHGSHLSLAHDEAWRICQALVARGVVPDFRPPDIIRFGIAPLYTRFADLAEAVGRLDAIMREGSWREFPARATATVT